MKRNITLIFAVIILGFLVWLTYPYLKKSASVGRMENIDPLNTTYTIEGKDVKWVNGKAEEYVAPNSVSKVVTTVFGKPSYGDLNADGLKDAVTLATQDAGGSGTFYYALVAINKDGKYQGLNAILLGDRIAPQSVLIKDNVASVNFAERAQGEPMTTAPSVGATKYLVVNQDKVQEFNLLNKGEQLFAGNLIMAHEARVFTPCGGIAHWVVGTSPAYSELTRVYTDFKATTSPYASVYVVVSGVIVDTPNDGFAKDYSYGIDIKNVLKVLPDSVCQKS